MSLKDRLNTAVSEENDDETGEIEAKINYFSKPADKETDANEIVFQEPAIDVSPEELILPRKGGKTFSFKQSSFVLFVATLIFFMIVGYIFFYYFS